MKIVGIHHINMQSSASSSLGGGATLGSLLPRKSVSLKNLWKHFAVYENGRKDSIPVLSVIYDCLDTIFNLRGLKIIKNEKKEILAGFTYGLRKNKWDEKSMYVDSIARSKTGEFNEVTKKLMTKIYQSMKNTAKDNNAKEITLFVHAGETNLRKNYERLGFKIDPKCDVKKVYLMRVSIDNFLNNLYFKCRVFKEACGGCSILKTKPTRVN